MAPLCREFGISRVTGYKIFERYKACGTPLSAAHAPNGLWCADYTSEFLLGNRQYCYPLTITDYRSRYLLACEGLASTKSKFAFSVFERTFRDFGLPAAIRTDNGTPFASPWAMFGLSRLAVWWLRPGIRLQQQERFEDFIRV